MYLCFVKKALVAFVFVCVSINETFFVVFRTFWFDFILAATFPGLDDDVASCCCVYVLLELRVQYYFIRADHANAKRARTRIVQA